MLSRRRVIAAFALSPLVSAPLQSSAAQPSTPVQLEAVIAELEKSAGGRLGVAVRDNATGRITGHRMRERFPMLSTFKLLAVADVLGRVDAGLEQLDRRLVFQTSDVVVNSLVTKDRVGGSGMTLAELCDAAMIFSDNTAGNLLLSTIGGPAGLTAYIRNSGDGETRLDRWEPALNEAISDDPRDTTTPAAMLGHLSSIVFGTRLSPASRLRIQQWLIDNRTGATRLRAGIPPLWLAGDKTGTGERGTVNDIGVMWPPQRAPILACIYFTGSGADAAARNEVIAAAGRAIAKVYSA